MTNFNKAKAAKEAPNLLDDYDAIGFEADHCLVKYNALEVTNLVVEGTLAEMREAFSYPPEINDFDYEKNLDLCLNYSVWDVEHGIMIKLNEKG
jgi:hypothetical protein